MRASAKTKLSLHRWAQIIGLSPLHFGGVYVTDLAMPVGCTQPWLQYPWQDADRVSREEVAEAIAQAEANVEQLLGFRLCPSWETDEWRSTIRPFYPEFANLSITDIRGLGPIALAKWGHFITGGVQAKELILDLVDIVWSDADSDGYDETGTIAVATTVTDECEIAVFYPGKNGVDEWEIRPIKVSIAAGVATITLRREQTVLEALMESLSAEGVDGSDDANFLTEVDVYRRYNDPQTQVSFLWEPDGSGVCGCNGTGCSGCSYTTQTGCLMVRGDPSVSTVVYHPASWDQDILDFVTEPWAVGRQPDLVRLYYLAGLRDKSLGCSERDMPRQWENIIANYASSLLERPICDCGTAHNKVDIMRADLAFTGGAGEISSYNISKSDLDNPLGTRRGAILAWKQIRQSAVMRAVDA